jgi:hypothetical protein
VLDIYQPGNPVALDCLASEELEKDSVMRTWHDSMHDTYLQLCDGVGAGIGFMVRDPEMVVTVKEKFPSPGYVSWT